MFLTTSEAPPPQSFYTRLGYSSLEAFNVGLPQTDGYLLSVTTSRISGCIAANIITCSSDTLNDNGLDWTGAKCTTEKRPVQGRHRPDARDATSRAQIIFSGDVSELCNLAKGKLAGRRAERPPSLWEKLSSARW
ncbi:hypothetical protein EVAR_61950_1 [Eumeta japonica]|uniref:Uncharacterized protein n=1 Tax=Eumeta variegata TaxID=151549 RepID=A0A4C1ZKD6_EUMVA|nr:hypothetical protein EVAR_61950_1 [Eumeta japonica]